MSDIFRYGICPVCKQETLITHTGRLGPHNLPKSFHRPHPDEAIDPVVTDIAEALGMRSTILLPTKCAGNGALVPITLEVKW